MYVRKYTITWKPTVEKDKVRRISTNESGVESFVKDDYTGDAACWKKQRKPTRHKKDMLTYKWKEVLVIVETTGEDVKNIHAQQKKNLRKM